jgi:hypothetical protein
MALCLMNDETEWFDQPKGKKIYEWRVWSQKDQHLELFLEPSDMANHAALPEPLAGKIHHGRCYIRAMPQAGEEHTKLLLQSLFDDDEDTLQNSKKYREDSSIFHHGGPFDFF